MRIALLDPSLHTAPSEFSKVGHLFRCAEIHSIVGPVRMSSRPVVCRVGEAEASKKFFLVPALEHAPDVAAE
ncbi:hypothetical protein CERZMDRAFT_90060 [Cercospora zeae-maydis SCOH1-5]|uniref:Uncharacterized protein n=1 Tax=Cercospora zeae-maydis SCOH1-5 TaxID=717836 RepID=A0A6A6FRI5_9PEZI|nr:hypothetical protein CERZMDRAFT_90060 [Cercospora zeae-maydis SCOH1-5]